MKLGVSYDDITQLKILLQQILSAHTQEEMLKLLTKDKYLELADLSIKYVQTDIEPRPRIRTGTGRSRTSTK